jgi:hypothetical protein
VPFAANVLSNLAFVAVGIFGAIVWGSRRRVQLTRATAISLACVALGFFLTGAGSAWYHAPT